MGHMHGQPQGPQPIPGVNAVVAVGSGKGGVGKSTLATATAVRDARAGYEQTLAVLAHAKRHHPAVLTKSSLMLGLGETDAEIDATLGDLRAAGVDLVTLGQYLRPTLNHLPVERFVTPEEFDRYRERALALGFLECVSGPLVRSSYRAERALNRNNAGLDNSRAAR